MRELIQNEYNQIFGGVSCLDLDVWQNIQDATKDAARKDAVGFASITTLVVMAAAFGASSASVPITIAAGVLAAPYALAAGYHYSPAWNIVNLEA